MYIHIYIYIILLYYHDLRSGFDTCRWITKVLAISTRFSTEALEFQAALPWARSMLFLLLHWFGREFLREALTTATTSNIRPGLSCTLCTAVKANCLRLVHLHQSLSLLFISCASATSMKDCLWTCTAHNISSTRGQYGPVPLLAPKRPFWNFQCTSAKCFVSLRSCAQMSMGSFQLTDSTTQAGSLVGK